MLAPSFLRLVGRFELNLRHALRRSDTLPQRRVDTSDKEHTVQRPAAKCGETCASKPLGLYCTTLGDSYHGFLLLYRMTSTGIDPSAQCTADEGHPRLKRSGQPRSQSAPGPRLIGNKVVQGTQRIFVMSMEVLGQVVQGIPERWQFLQACHIRTQHPQTHVEIATSFANPRRSPPHTGSGRAGMSPVTLGRALSGSTDSPTNRSSAKWASCSRV